MVYRAEWVYGESVKLIGLLLSDVQYRQLRKAHGFDTFPCDSSLPLNATTEEVSHSSTLTQPFNALGYSLRQRLSSDYAALVPTSAGKSKSGRIRIPI